MTEPSYEERRDHRDTREPRGGGAVGLLAFMLGLALVVVLAIALFLVLNDGAVPTSTLQPLGGAEAPAGGR